MHVRSSPEPSRVPDSPSRTSRMQCTCGRASERVSGARCLAPCETLCGRALPGWQQGSTPPLSPPTPTPHAGARRPRLVEDHVADSPRPVLRGGPQQQDLQAGGHGDQHAASIQLVRVPGGRAGGWAGGWIMVGGWVGGEAHTRTSTRTRTHLKSRVKTPVSTPSKSRCACATTWFTSALLGATKTMIASGSSP